jgi:hypothetical protein
VKGIVERCPIQEEARSEHGSLSLQDDLKAYVQSLGVRLTNITCRQHDAMARLKILELHLLISNALNPPFVRLYRRELTLGIEILRLGKQLHYRADLFL